ncbi:hypothetical protein ACTWQF_10530 [Streptomyces sp. 8N114]|uniref:hypothetical protein n=1 Tax=Streptomyces sp. 8N114 TaxID=3457419 RepID=UPI003FD1B6B9
MERQQVGWHVPSPGKPSSTMISTCRQNNCGNGTLAHTSVLRASVEDPPIAGLARRLADDPDQRHSIAGVLNQQGADRVEPVDALPDVTVGGGNAQRAREFLDGNQRRFLALAVAADGESARVEGHVEPHGLHGDRAPVKGPQACETLNEADCLLPEARIAGSSISGDVGAELDPLVVAGRLQLLECVDPLTPTSRLAWLLPAHERILLQSQRPLGCELHA